MPSAPMTQANSVTPKLPPESDLPGRVLGALIGTVVGVAGSWLALQRGTDILVVVGAGLALGVSRGSRRRSVPWAIFTAVLAPVVCLLVFWWFRPFAENPSFGFFLGHLAELPRAALTSLGAVALAGAWFGVGRNRRKPG